MEICVCVVKHYRTLVLAFLLTRVITKKSYEMEQLFFAAPHQRCTALHKSCLSTIWLFFCIFTEALLQLSVSLLQQSQKWTAAANGKQRLCNLSAALTAALISRYSRAVLMSSVLYGRSTFCNNILYITLSISGRCWTLRSLYVTMVKD